MIHEVAHAMLHDSDQMKQRGEEKDQLTKETEAESIASVSYTQLEVYKRQLGYGSNMSRAFRML